MPKGSLSETGFALNRTAVDILNLCDGQTSVAIIIDNMVKKYETSRNEIVADVHETLELLKEANLITNY